MASAPRYLLLGYVLFVVRAANKYITCKICKIILKLSIKSFLHLVHCILQLKDAAGKYGAVQHCFPVYGGGLEVQGVEGILQVQYGLLHVTLLCKKVFCACINTLLVIIFCSTRA